MFLTIFMKISNYTKDSKFFDPDNIKTICKMKDEFKGEVIREFFGLKSKIPPKIRFDEDVFNTSSILIFSKDQYIRIGHLSSRRLEDVFKTSSKCLGKTFSRHLQDVFKTF